MSVESHNAPLASGKSPKAGCAIMVIIFTIVATLIGVTLSQPFIQMNAMKDFTTTQKSQLTTSDPLTMPPADLTAKLSAQSEDISTSAGPITLSYSADDLNNAIRSYEVLKDLRGLWAVREITPAGIVLDVCHPINHNPLSSDKTPRFLVATMKATVAQKNDELILKITEAQSPHGEIPEGFLQHFQEYRVMQPYTDHPEIGPAMFATQEIQHGNGVLTLTLSPNKYADPAATKPVDDLADKRAKRRFLMPLMSFLMVAGIFFFMVKRRNAKEAQRWKQQADQE